MRYDIKKIMYLIIAFICLAIGAVGVALPVLPTTPFLLLASFCFAKGSKKFHRWFLTTKIYKNHLEDFIESRTMTLKGKIAILTPASIMLIVAIVFVPMWHVRLFLGALILFKYYYFLFRIKTMK